MGRLQNIVVVLSLFLITANAPMSNSSMENDEPASQNEPIIPKPLSSQIPKPLSAPTPSPLTPPSSIKLWEAHAKGFAPIASSSYANSYIISNTGTIDFVIDEFAVIMSPNPYEGGPENPTGDRWAQDGALTNGSVTSGSYIEYNYGDYVVGGSKSPPPWWCTEDSEFTAPNVDISLTGEILPFDLWDYVNNPDGTQVYYDRHGRLAMISLTQANIWNYLRDNAAPVIGKTPMWKSIPNLPTEVDISIAVTNIGFKGASNVVVKDKLPSDYQYKSGSASPSPASIIVNPDNSTDLTWNLGSMRGAIQTDDRDPTDYAHAFITYTFKTPELFPDDRIFLPRALVDKNNDGAMDAHSEEPLLETYFVNRDPVAIAEDIKILEGETANLNGSSSYDPDEPYGDSIVSYEWDLDGDGNPDKYGPLVSQEYGDDGIYAITLTVTDSHGASSSTTVTVTVYNVAPTIVPLLDTTINEGNAAIFDASATDPGSDDLTFTWEFELGPTITNVYYNDGSGPDPDPSPGGTYPFSIKDTVEHTYSDDGKYTITLTVEDDDGNSTSSTANVTVNNVAPTVTLFIPSSGDEGFSINFSADATDPGSDDLTFEWQFSYGPTITNIYYNDGVGPDAIKSPWGVYPFNASDVVTHTYGDDYDYTINLVVTDDDGGMFTYNSAFTVHNLAPSIILVAIPITIYEGSISTFLAKAKDFGSDDLTFEWDFGDSTTIVTSTYYNDGIGPDPDPSPNGTFPFTASDTLNHIYGDDYNYTLSLKVTDDDGGMTTFTTTVIVYNVAPTIEPFGPFKTDEGSEFTLIANCTDLGSDDLTFNWEFELGPSRSKTYFNDGVGPDPKPSPWGTFPFSISDSVIHTYGDDYQYNLTLTVTDDDGGQTTFNTTIKIENVLPTIEPFGPFTTDENLPSDLTAISTDPGSDDLTFIWKFEFGPTITNTYYNDGIGPDPYPSPGGTFPFSATDSVSHTYGDNGVFNVTLILEDDDNGITTYMTNITVNNVAPTIEPIDPYEIDEGLPFDLIAISTDPGSDDLTFTWEFELGPTITNVHYNNGISPDPYPSPNVNTMDIMDSASHTYGDNGVFMVTLTVTDDDNGYSITTTNVTVNNVAPTVNLNEPDNIDENTPLTLNGIGTDPGSDDLTFTWKFEFGPIISNVYYNNGVGPDPIPSPEVNPMDVIDDATHTYGDNGVFNVTLTVKDDDGGVTEVPIKVIVKNVAPTITNIEAYIYVNFTLRVAGEKWHSVGIHLYEDGSEISSAVVTRYPGNPDEQTGTITNAKIDLTKSYKALVDYLPNDPRENGNVWGANPVWIDIAYEDGSVKRLHHTFNVRKSYWNSDHWNHIDPWEVELSPHFAGQKITFEASASDPGSDDLFFCWDLGDGNCLGPNIYYNNELCPDPYPSPEIKPITCTDSDIHKYSNCGVYCVTLTVEDDDGGICIATITLTVG